MGFEKNSLLSLDEIINDIGFGKFQLRIYVVAFLCIFQFISHNALSGYILPTITIRWSLSLFEQSLLGCLEYSMQVIASLITSYSAPFGRKKPILIAIMVWTVSVFLTCIFDNFFAFLIFRSFTSCSSLVGNLISYTLLSEVLPVENRGKILGTFEFTVVLGQLQIICFMLFSFNSLGDGNIHLLFWLLFISMATSCVTCFLICDESPRNLCFSQHRKESITLLDKIFKENNKGIKSDGYMNLEKQESFMKWVDLMEEEERKNSNEKNVGLSSLFQGNYKKITITLYLVWFANCFVSAGNDYILPLTLYKLHNSQEQEGSPNLIMIFFYINLISLPFLIPAVLATDMKLFGRKKTLTISLFMIGISCFFMWGDFFLNIVIWFFIVKYGISINYMILSIYTNEIYPTTLRSLGYGTSCTLGKIGSIFSPLICVFLSDVNPLMPFALFSFVSLIGGIKLFNLKYDTTNEAMDRILTNDDVEMKLVQKTEL